jgi:NodT family efflux transporter outer membrane factor (OMF) lipoprotein
MVILRFNKTESAPDRVLVALSQNSKTLMWVGPWIFTGLLWVFVAGCADLAGPKYERPDVPTKEDWSEVSKTQVSPSETIQPDWWTGFDDPYLNKLVQQAISGGSDLKILAARVDVAAVSIGAEKAGALPKVTGSSAGNFQKQTGQVWQQQYSVQQSLNWEIDIWGKVRKGVNAKKAQFQASEADWRAGYLVLVSDVANKYFDIRQFDEQINQQKKAQATNLSLLKIYEAQLKEGLIPESKLLSQEAEISSLTNQLLDLQRQREVTEFSLATLLGMPAGNLKVPAASLTDSVKVMDVPGGLPSDLLTRRPDIIAQEYRVLAAHELVGQAKLARLPSISLTSTAGSSSDALSKLLKTSTFGIGPSISIPIFDPSIKANIKSTSASARVVEEEYRKTVLTAFEEVETALTNLAYRKKQKRELEAQIRNLTIVRDVRYAKLQEGLVSQLEVFDTDRSLLAAQQTVLQTHKQILADTVNLYKALGGGWPKESVGQASP